MSTLEIFSSPLYVRVFFRTVDLCRIIFTPSHFVRRKNGSTGLVFCLKMPPEYQFVLQFVAIRRPNALNVTHLFTTNDKINAVLL